jgi:hypothetical protein
MVEEARREPPRFAVRVAVEVERCGEAIVALIERRRALGGLGSAAATSAPPLRRPLMESA